MSAIESVRKELNNIQINKKTRNWLHRGKSDNDVKFQPEFSVF